MHNSRRFITLDGLRGVAAIMVMLGHAGKPLSFEATHTYLAVDLFFALSGFVLACAYEDRFRQGLTTGQFTLLRLARVYPMYVVGTLGGMLIIGGSPLALLFVPDISQKDIYYSNAPMWSLMTELLVNIGYAACASRIGTRGLIAILCISGFTIMVGIISHGHANLGSTWVTAGYGLIRTVFSFTLGVGMFRLRRHIGIVSRQSWLAWMLVPVLVTVLVVSPVPRTVYDLTCIFLLLPAILWLGSLWEAPKSLPLELLGNLSFPLYCIHDPFVTRYSGSPLGVAICCAVMVVLALWCNRIIDRPARTALFRLIQNGRYRSAMA